MSWKDLICNVFCNHSRTKLNTLEAKVGLLENKLSSKGIPDWFKKEDDKYPKAKITYLGRPILNSNIKPRYDVRSFIAEKDYVFQEEIGKIPISYRGKTDREVYDSIVLDIAKYLAPKIKYVTDTKNFGFNEYWAQPQDTWALRQDDCEGSTNLFISFMLNAGIPHFLLRNCCGSTFSGFGHSTLYYYASDNKWHHIEATKNKFFEKSALDFPLRTEKDQSNIEDVWFSFDAHNSFHKFITATAMKTWEGEKNNFVIQ